MDNSVKNHAKIIGKSMKTMTNYEQSWTVIENHEAIIENMCKKKLFTYGSLKSQGGLYGSGKAETIFL